MTLLVLTFFSGARIEVGEFCLVGSLGYKISSSTLVYSLIQRVLMFLLVLAFFSGVRIEVGEFCNSLTEVPCC